MGVVDLLLSLGWTLAADAEPRLLLVRLARVEFWWLADVVVRPPDLENRLLPPGLLL